MLKGNKLEYKKKNSPRRMKTIKKTTAQKMDRTSPLLIIILPSSAKGLRSDMRPKPPKEMLMSKKNESLFVDLARKEAEPRDRGLASDS